MAIENVIPGPVIDDGWLEVDPKWLAMLWHLQPTGDVKCVLGKIHVGIRGPGLAKGQIVEGSFMTAIVPTHVQSRADGPWGTCS